MTPEERQALREKHKPHKIPSYEGEWCSYCEYFNVDSNGWTGEYNSIPYPCDVIKVLDAWEAENDYWTQIENGTLPEMEVNECDHMTGVMFWTNGARFAYASERLGNKPWTYCPKCGVKL